MAIALLRHFKQTQDFTSFPRQAIIAHQSKLNSYFRALQYRIERKNEIERPRIKEKRREKEHKREKEREREKIQ